MIINSNIVLFRPRQHFNKILCKPNCFDFYNSVHKCQDTANHSEANPAMSSRKRLADSVLPLHYFIRKSQVIHTFRSLLRSAGKIDDLSLRDDIKTQIISNFRLNKNIPSDQISIALQDANNQLKIIQTMEKRHSIPQDSWLHSSTNDDIKGRIGTGWPWQR